MGVFMTDGGDNMHTLLRTPKQQSSQKMQGSDRFADNLAQVTIVLSPLHVPVIHNQRQYKRALRLHTESQKLSAL
jgi:hypothetical protein